MAMVLVGAFVLAKAMDWTNPLYMTPIAWVLGAALIRGGLIAGGICRSLIRILSALFRADAGAATVHGYDVAGLPGKVRESISLTDSRRSTRS